MSILFKIFYFIFWHKFLYFFIYIQPYSCLLYTSFLAAGCQVFSLHYSVAPETFPVALMELAKVVALVKSHACEWNIDTERIMVCGFSAGGHLAACLGMMWNREFLYGPLHAAPEDIQPKGMILCYPVITSGTFGHQRSFEQLLGDRDSDPLLRELVSLELQAGPHTPRTFLWHTWTDQSVPAENSLLLAQALKKAGVRLSEQYPQCPLLLSRTVHLAPGASS